MLAALFPSCGGKSAPAETPQADTSEPAPSGAVPEPTAGPASESPAESPSDPVAEAVSAFVGALAPEEMAAQLFLVNVEGSGSYRALETRPDGRPLVPGGALLFSYNVADTAEAVAAYTESVRSFSRSSSLVPPFVAVDQEGGDVNRLRGITSVLWSERKVAERFSVEGASALYGAQARQLRLLGIDMNLAPVVEAETADNAEFLGTRSFGGAQDVLAYGGAEIAAFEGEGVASCLKHFPGNSATDPHVGLPRISLGEGGEAGFAGTFDSLAPGASAVLMSHAVVSVGGSAETAMPACFSPFWVGRLRSSFGGLIVSDDVFMGALAANGYPPDRAAVAAVRAGVDVVMLSEKLFAGEVRRLLDEAGSDPSFAGRVRESAERVVAFKVRAGILSVEDDGSGGLRVVQGKPRAFDAGAFASARKAGLDVYSTGGKGNS